MHFSSHYYQFNIIKYFFKSVKIYFILFSFYYRISTNNFPILIFSINFTCFIDNFPSNSYFRVSLPPD